MIRIPARTVMSLGLRMQRIAGLWRAAERQRGVVLWLGVLMSLLPPGWSSDWPRWRGSERNGTTAESDWSAAWAKEGPPLLWKASVGIGFSSVSVAGGRVYTMGNTDGMDSVFCCNAADGTLIWKHSYPCGLRPQYYEGGTSVTPTVDGHSLYTLSKEGHLYCFDSATGDVSWTIRLTQQPGAIMPRWGFAGSPLVQDDLLILNAGSAGMAVAKSNGQIKWFSGKEAAGYATPLPVTIEGRPCVLIFAAKALVCAALEDGSELWRYPWVTKWDLNIADPIVSGDKVFISTFDRGGALLKMSRQGATEVWHNQSMANHFSTSVLYEGALYGITGNTDRPPAEFRCVDFASGELKWSQGGLGCASLMIADGKLIVLSDKGELVVADASQERFQASARAQVLGGKCWIPPVLANGRIYCRNAQGTLVCLDVRKR
ncbi:MAG: PQQ-binding-like beta-propeller repeat protein [Verrucomicrobiota bacterium]